MNKPIQVIRCLTDANELLDRGHKIIHISRDQNNKKFLLFSFQNTEQLQIDLKEITKN